MRKHSRITRSLVVAASAILALTACGGGGSGEEGSDDGGSATAGTINWWSWTPDNNVAEREIKAFNEQYPDIEVIYKKVPIDNYAAVLKPALASDVGPDVYTVNASGSFSAEAFAPYAQDLTPDVVKLLGEDRKTKVYDGGVNAFTVKDRLVAAQWAKVGAGIMWINQQMFDKYDLEPPTNLAEWESVCKTFRSEGLGCFREGMAGTAGFVVDTLHSIADSHQPGVWAGAISGAGKWTDPVMVQSLATLRTLSENGILDEGAVGIQQYPDVNNAFLSGKVPMVQMGTWYQQYATVDSLTAALDGAGVPKDTPKITIVPIEFPDVAGKGNPPTMFADPDAGHSVNAKSKNRNAAITFALWMGHTKEGQQIVVNNMDSFATLNGVSPQFDKIKLVDPEVQKPKLEEVTAALGEAKDARSLGLSAEVSDAVINACQAMVNGNKPPEEAAADIQAVADATKK